MDYKKLRDQLTNKLSKNLNKIDSFRPIFKYIDEKLPDRARKEATAEETLQLIEWAILRNEPWNGNMMAKFFEQKFGWQPKWKNQQSELRWEQGQECIFERSNCKDEMLMDVVSEHDGKTGMVEETEKSNRDLENPGGEPGDIIVDLDSGGKVRVPHGQRKKNSGLKTPDTGFGGAKVEFVYFSDPSYSPDPDRQQQVDEYLERQEGRSENYYSGTPMGGPKENKSGKLYLTVDTDQRGFTAINPAKGKLLYMGVLGKRPSGLQQDIEKWSD